MKLLIKKLDSAAEIKRGTPEAYCIDVKCTAIEEPNEQHPNTWKCYTGLAFEIRRNFLERLADKLVHRVWSLKAYPRSSIMRTGEILSNSIGIIDQDYRGEITAHFYAFPFPRPERYRQGERIIQLVIEAGYQPPRQEVEELSHGGRGLNGYGSTGK